MHILNPIQPHNVYGEYQNLGDKYRNVVGIFMNQLMQNKPLSVFGDGLQTRAFSYIGDVAPHIANAVNIPKAYNQVFNIGADKEFTVKELADTVCEVMEMKSSLRFLPARNEVMHAYADHAKAHNVFGTGSNISLKDGLTRMFDWAKKAGIKKSTKFEGIEITEKLPSFWIED